LRFKHVRPGISGLGRQKSSAGLIGLIYRNPLRPGLCASGKVLVIAGRHPVPVLRQILIAIGLALGLTLLTGAGLYVYRLPTTLVIAVGVPGSDDERLVSGIAQRLAAENAPLRLKLLPRENPATAATALDNGEADLAVIRSDLTIPGSARAIAIFHRNVVLLMAGPSAKVKRVSDLAGKTIGVIGHPGMNDGILDTILKQHNIALSAVQVVTLRPSEVPDVMRTKRIDAFLAVGPLEGRPIAEALGAFARSGRAPVFLDIENAAGIAKRTSAFEEAEIVAGSFGGNRPAEAITTLGFQNYLVARQSLPESTVTDFTRLLFNLRPSLAIDFPAAARIEAPDTKRDARLLVHPGAAAYIDGEERSFFDVYGDWLYYGLIGFGLLGSAFTWMVRTLTPAARLSNNTMLERLLSLLVHARKASTTDELNELEGQADDIFTNAVRKAEAEALDETQLMTFSLALEYLRQAIAERREWLQQGATAATATNVTPLQAAPGMRMTRAHPADRA
jgi:TRAP transporter TAXI family solute receptor